MHGLSVNLTRLGIVSIVYQARGICKAIEPLRYLRLRVYMRDGFRTSAVLFLRELVPL